MTSELTQIEGTLDDTYFEWLYKNYVGSVRNRNPARSHWELAKQLYTTRFDWFVANDDNRAEDGKELRDDFITECDIQDVEVLWLEIECSMLEMLIALARRAAFESFGEPGEWLWKLLQNIDLKQYTDDRYDDTVRGEVDATLHRVINREYQENGYGGLFPLQNARKDQRKVELWYQMQAYMLEGDYINHGP